MNAPKYRIRRGVDAAWFADSNRPYYWTDIPDRAAQFSQREWASRLMHDPRYQIEGMEKAVIEEFMP